ncbi:hypothetical protein HRbin40_00890 [bacterium HR40]|nr:hypothetical protein HRbin40_00890 [bacterium HR40]
MTETETEAAAAGAAGQSSAGAWEPAEKADRVVLNLSELLCDENGEVVLYNDSGFRRVVLEADARPVAQGMAEPHLTASGEQVAGYAYVAFDNGMTLYYPPDLELIVVPGPA